MTDDEKPNTRSSPEVRAWLDTFRQSPIPGPAKDDAPEIARRLAAAREKGTER